MIKIKHLHSSTLLFINVWWHVLVHLIECVFASVYAVCLFYRFRNCFVKLNYFPVRSLDVNKVGFIFWKKSCYTLIHSDNFIIHAFSRKSLCFFLEYLKSSTQFLINSPKTVRFLLEDEKNTHTTEEQTAKTATKLKLWTKLYRFRRLNISIILYEKWILFEFVCSLFLAFVFQFYFLYLFFSFALNKFSAL